MSNRLIEKTSQLRRDDKRGLSPYVTAGDGGLDATLAILHALDKGGADCVELGLPFSDPIADGPVLQAAAERALDDGTSLNEVLSMLKTFRDEGGNLPIALMSYANPLVRHGLNETANRIAQAGGDALIIPDIPLEEGAQLEIACESSGLCPIFFAAPTSNNRRIEMAGARSRGFLYVVGRTGVTGSGTRFDEKTQSFLQRARELSAAPIAVGFGIDCGEAVRAATKFADLAIVGTALVRHLHQCGGNAQQRAQAASEFLDELKSGLN